jgi:omega-6 fatty acid desaturase (delta-12 desaturase)
MNQSQVSLKKFRPGNWQAAGYLAIPGLLLLCGLYLSVSGNSTYTWVCGQLLLGIFFFQGFILLHETGHFSFFRSAFLNRIFGHVFGFLSFIPFTSWVAIHNLHHRWTGWRDKDPTTEGTVAPKFGKANRLLVNIAWSLSLPLFTIAYRLGNYWNPAKLNKHLPLQKLKPIRLNQLLQLALYLLAFIFFGKFMLDNLLAGYLISLVVSDVFILSQHSHIEMPLANGREVKPLKYPEQVPYTRSLGLNRFLARFFFLNFNLHELHHAYPGIPAYHLNRIGESTPNQIPFWKYLFKFKRMPGMKFIFSTESKT